MTENEPATPPLILLTYPVPIRYPSDVARLRRVLNDRGYDASYSDIQSAFSDWSESEHAAGWVGIGGMSEAEMFEALWTRLEHMDGLEHDDQREDAK